MGRKAIQQYKAKATVSTKNTATMIRTVDVDEESDEKSESGDAVLVVVAAGVVVGVTLQVALLLQ